MNDHESRTTTDVEEIRRWAEKRGGRPAKVKVVGEEGEGILRLYFGPEEENLEEISWEEFEQIFEENKLAFLYQEETAEGGESRFFKFIRREE